MTDLPDDLDEVLRVASPLDAVVYLTTTSRDGRPNLLPQPFTDTLPGGFVLFPDLFAQKTKVNLNEHAWGLVSVAWPREDSGWRIEGPTTVIQWGHPASYQFHGLRAGDILERWGNWETRESFDALSDELRPQVVAQRGVIVVKAEKVWRQEGSTSWPN